jgi:hypothetical protein
MYRFYDISYFVAFFARWKKLMKMYAWSNVKVALIIRIQKLFLGGSKFVVSYMLALYIFFFPDVFMADK